MELIEGHSLDTVVRNIEILSQGMEKDAALMIAINMAKAYWRRENPTKTKWPKHLEPGNCVKSVNEALKERGAVNGK